MKTDKEIDDIMLGMVRERAQELYSEMLLQHGINPRTYGAMEEPDAHARITGDCGDTVEFYLRIREGRIEAATFTTDGCMFSIASCSVAAEMATGRTLSQCIGINQSAIADRLETIPADHEHCALLAAMTLQRAIRDYIDDRKRDPSSRA